MASTWTEEQVLMYAGVLRSRIVELDLRLHRHRQQSPVIVNKYELFKDTNFPAEFYVATAARATKDFEQSLEGYTWDVGYHPTGGFFCAVSREDQLPARLRARELRSG